MNPKKFIPILDWLPKYNKAFIKGDISAGITVGIMLIPQGMAYAAIAGLPLVYGLYAALIPQIIYAILGTSRQLAVGPVALDSLLVASGISMFAQAESPEYISLAILLAFMVGSIQLLFGILKLGFLVNFLSKPVISGFTSAAAIIIGLSQLKDLFGIDMPRVSRIQDVVYNSFTAIARNGIQWVAFIIGIIGILILLFIKKINKKYKLRVPAALVVVVVGIIVVYVFKLNILGVKIVGMVPNSLPSPSLPAFSLENIQNLFPIALTLSLVAFMEAISIAKAMQNKHQYYEINNNQELIALGCANIFGSIFKSFPTTGGFGRTAVNNQAGAKSGLAPIISATIIALTLIILTPLFYFLPKAILASIIMVAVFGLINYKYPIKLWKTQKKELLMLLVTFLVTLTVGIREGILIGVGFSLIIMIYETTQPHFAELGNVPNSEEYRNVKRFDEVLVREDVLILRYDASLYFANIFHFKENLNQLKNKKKEKLKLIILHCESINTIDSSALDTLSGMISTLKKENIKFYMTCVKGPIRDILFKTGVMDEIGKTHFFMNIAHAMSFYDKVKGHSSNLSKGYATQNKFEDKN